MSMHVSIWQDVGARRERARFMQVLFMINGLESRVIFYHSFRLVNINLIYLRLPEFVFVMPDVDLSRTTCEYEHG